jgi:hypothetical protein
MSASNSSECFKCGLHNHFIKDCVVLDEEIVQIKHYKEKIAFKNDKLNDNDYSSIFKKDKKKQIKDNIKKFENMIDAFQRKYDNYYKIKKEKEKTDLMNEKLKKKIADNDDEKDKSFKCQYCTKCFTTINGARYHEFKYCTSNPNQKK